MDTSQTPPRLALIEKAARIYCKHTEQNPDATMRMPHPTIHGAFTETPPLWHEIAERMLDLSMLLAAMKAAAKEDTA